MPSDGIGSWKKGPPAATGPSATGISVFTVDDEAAVLAANRRYYEAFEAKNMDAMSDLWERSDRAICTHPGWATLEGWGPVAASFFALFQGGQHIQFVLTREAAVVEGDTAWVSLDENLLGDQGGVTVATVNIFVRSASHEWRMVCHHGSVVQPAPPG